MSRDFNPVSPSIWNSAGFLSLDSDGRQLMLYFLTGPHQNSAGCARVREGYALADLGWQSKQFRTALANVVGAGLVMHDPATEETYVHKWFQHKGNIPTNKDHAKGTMKIIANIDSDEIRERAEADFMETEWAAKTFAPVDPSPLAIPMTSALANSSLVRNGTNRGVRWDDK